ncbi:hypothetical protein CAPTEDRAFT_203874 [Capitella teleta]|uniref:Uncharacterized protein n=1 Tax=Capitella teleta TaxID=283909 RepID=R7UWQ9_CAPTE|nr:hypothetical protein CAPTEDRAFT_203874 [Capitella teleta]|eukprot:ELU07846.1 hypothetical protein CAPTEDRAFT_203874 [Capitella teleta]
MSEIQLIKYSCLRPRNIVYIDRMLILTTTTINALGLNNINMLQQIRQSHSLHMGRYYIRVTQCHRPRSTGINKRRGVQKMGPAKVSVEVTANYDLVNITIKNINSVNFKKYLRPDTSLFSGIPETPYTFTSPIMRAMVGMSSSKSQCS